MKSVKSVVYLRLYSSTWVGNCIPQTLIGANKAGRLSQPVQLRSWALLGDMFKLTANYTNII